MAEFRVELYLGSNDEEDNEKFTDLAEEDMARWKRDAEARALSEFYHQKIKVSDQNN